jgi:two-component system NtrC family sensor kinase
MKKSASENSTTELNFKRNYERLLLMQEVSQYQATDVQTLLDFALQKVIDLTESSIGYIYHYHEKEQQFVLNSWSRDVMATCNVAAPQSIYHLENTGIWGEVVRQRRPIMINDYQAPSPLKKGCPEGHVSLSRFLSIPVMEQGSIVAVVGVANKKTPYDKSDQLQLTLMMEGVWKIAVRLKLEEQVLRAGHEWQSTFDSISDSIALIDPEQRVLRCNKSTGKILGLDFADIINQPCWKLFHGSDVPIPDCPMVKAKSSLHSEVTTIRHHDRWLVVSVDPMVSDEGSFTGAVHIVRDVTDNKLAEEKLKKSQELLAETARIAQMGGWEINLQSNSLSWTEQIYLIYEVEPDFQPTVAGTIAYYAPESLPVITEAIQRAIEYGESFDLELYLVSAKGNRKLVNAIGKVEWQDGKVGKISGTFKDITEHREMENALARQASVLEGVLESTDAAIFSVDRDYCYTSFNSVHAGTMKALYGADIRIGVSILDYMTPEDMWVSKGDFDRAFSGKTFVVETDSGDVQMLQCFFEISHNPILNADGQVTGVAVFARDITDRKQAEQAMLDMQAQVIQQEKLASIGQVAAGVAHEINNPVGFVRSNLVSLGKYIDKLLNYVEFEQSANERYLPAEMKQLLAEKWRQAKLDFIVKDIREMIRESQEGAERIKKTIQDLMSFARKEKDEFVPVDLNVCLESTLTIAWNEIKNVAELKKEIGELPVVMGNMQKLSQVFLNLLINASHAIAGYGTIEVRTWSEAGNACVAISDNGCGIPAELREKIFEPFFTTKEAGRGTGLGLAISADIVKKHHGIIEVTSEAGVGTTFTVRLPVEGAGSLEVS